MITNNLQGAVKVINRTDITPSSPENTNSVIYFSGAAIAMCAA